MKYSVLVNCEGTYRPTKKQVSYGEAHSEAARRIEEGLGVQVVQHGRYGDCVCCTSAGYPSTLVNVL